MSHLRYITRPWPLVFLCQSPFEQKRPENDGRSPGVPTEVKGWHRKACTTYSLNSSLFQPQTLHLPLNNKFPTPLSGRSLPFQTFFLPSFLPSLVPSFPPFFLPSLVSRFQMFPACLPGFLSQPQQEKQKNKTN